MLYGERYVEGFKIPLVLSKLLTFVVMVGQKSVFPVVPPKQQVGFEDPMTPKMQCSCKGAIPPEPFDLL